MQLIDYNVKWILCSCDQPMVIVEEKCCMDFLLISLGDSSNLESGLSIALDWWGIIPGEVESAARKSQTSPSYKHSLISFLFVFFSFTFQMLSA